MKSSEQVDVFKDTINTHSPQTFAATPSLTGFQSEWDGWKEGEVEKKKYVESGVMGESNREDGW